MPNQLVRDAWQDHFGNSNRHSLKNAMPQGSGIGGEPDAELVRAMNEAGGFIDDGRWEEIVRPIADRCKVSPVAMRIRLEKLGLIVRDNQQRNLAAGQK